MVKGFRLKRDCIIPGHIPIEIELEGEMVAEEQTILRNPQKIDTAKIEALPEEFKERIATEAWNVRREQFEQARKNKATEKAWRIASQAAERYLKRCAKSCGLKVEDEQERGGASVLDCKLYPRK